MNRFVVGQKAALISLSSFGPSRITPVTVEKVTKTQLTIRHANGHVSETVYRIREHLNGTQEGRLPRGSHRYYREHVEVWTEAHDARLEARAAEAATQRRLNAIRDRVSKLHVSEVDLIAALAAVLKIDAEAQQ